MDFDIHWNFREAAFKKRGTKQLNHVRGTDGWWLSMMVIEVRCFQYNYAEFLLLNNRR